MNAPGVATSRLMQPLNVRVGLVSFGVVAAGADVVCIADIIVTNKLSK
jgi:hypothetical protein